MFWPSLRVFVLLPALSSGYISNAAMASTARRRNTLSAILRLLGLAGQRCRRPPTPIVASVVLVIGMVGATAVALRSAGATTTSWAIVKSPNPSTTWNSLNGVSCFSASRCMAVGGTSGGTIAEWFNGTKWSLANAPVPKGAEGPVLNDVSCPSADSCFAVGSSNIPDGVQTLVESWNGTVWKTVPSPNGIGGRTGLNGVSCLTSNSCMAVGYQALGGHDDESLAESWNGSTWKTVPTPSPVQTTGVPSSYLQSVSCVSTRNCKAVGSSEIGMFVESWNGTTWSIIHSPATAPFGSPVGISCADRGQLPCREQYIGRILERISLDETARTSGKGPYGLRKCCLRKCRLVHCGGVLIQWHRYPDLGRVMERPRLVEDP